MPAEGQAAGSRGTLPGDAPLAAFLGRRGWQFGVLGAALTMLVCIGFLAAGVLEIWRDGKMPPVDFVVFWGSAKLALQGEWSGIFDTQRLAVVHGASVEGWFPWLYPPGFLLAMMPLGAVSFPVAWLAFSGGSLAAVALAVRRFDGRVLPAWLAFAFAPAYLPALMLGQTGVIWLAGLVAALAALRAGRPVLAGVLIGCLTLKPQLGLLVPVALLASRQWTAIAAASVTAAVVALVPTLWFGPAFWGALGDAMSTHFGYIKADAAGFHLMPTVYAELRALGLSHGPGIAVQWTVTALAGLVVARAWSDPGAGFDLRAGVLLAAIPLATPYLWYYDAAFTAAAALFLLRAGAMRFSAGWFPLLVLMWAGAGPATLAELLTPETAVPVRELVLPVIAAGFAVAAGAVLRGRPAAAPGLA